MKIGDIVRLKSGGPLMTVIGVLSPEYVRGGWFVMGEHQTCQVPPEALVHMATVDADGTVRYTEAMRNEKISIEAFQKSFAESGLDS